MKSMLAAKVVSVFAASAMAVLVGGCADGDSSADSTSSDSSTSGGDIPVDISVTGSNNQVYVDQDIYMIQPGGQDNSQKAGNDIKGE